MGKLSLSGGKGLSQTGYSGKKQPSLWAEPSAMTPSSVASILPSPIAGIGLKLFL